MRWLLTHSDAEKARKIYKRRGIPIPAHLWPPKLLPGADEWLGAFTDLSTERQIGMGPGPIPASAIEAWPVDAAERETFKACMRAMDHEYLTHYRTEEASPADTATLVAALRKDD